MAILSVFFSILAHSAAESSCSAHDRVRVSECGLTDEDDVIVVRRVSHAIKALRTRTGEQRWNYSVAQNHLRLERGPGRPAASPAAARSSRAGGGDVVMATCPHRSPLGLEDLRFDVVAGSVFVRGAAEAEKEKRHDFQVPIAHAWLLAHGQLSPIDLFGGNAVGGRVAAEPAHFLTYLGRFNDQYYLQHSSQMRHLVSMRHSRQTSQELEWLTAPGPHYGTKPGHFETSKIHFPTSEGVSEVSERANE